MFFDQKNAEPSKLIAVLYCLCINFFVSTGIKIRNAQATQKTMTFNGSASFNQKQVEILSSVY
jgi:hypothetical protein